MNAFEQLAAYRKAGSEQAFSELVCRYANLVFSMAKRRLADGALAEDVAQTVFARLAKSPPNLGSDGELVAWLHRTTTHVAIDFWRSETRRRTREQPAALMQSTTTEDTRAWEDLSPHLDQALDELNNDADRQAVLLRFFERRPMHDIGRTLGVSEDAAKMRVSRALDRLRNQLALRGIACTVLALAAVLPQHTVEAAPASLLASLQALSLAAPTAAGTGGLAGLIPQLAKSKAALGAAAALALAIVALVCFSAPEKEVASGATPTDTPATEPAGEASEPFAPSHIAATEPALKTQENVRFVLRIIDRETGAGLAGAQVRASYFYAGGVGERHELQGDAEGNVPIPYPNKPDKNAGLNVFVGVAGYVPKAISFGRLKAPAENYVLELDSALAVGGLVVDENGQPVPGVELEAQKDPFVPYNKTAPNTDFQTTKVTTDAEGRWRFRYVPKEYAAIDFYLTCSNYAATRVSVPVGKPESLSATVVINRGFVVTGQVTDAQGQSVAGATVKEFHNYGYRKLFAKTDQDGLFALCGLCDPAEGRKADLVVQAAGLSPQLQAVPLLERTNTANFVLAPGNIFRGRVVDEAGNPIPEASVRTDWDNQGRNRFEWQTHTDADGRFDWDAAPAEPVCFWFEADGYMMIRDHPLLPDGTDHEIRLMRDSRATANR